MAALVTVRRPRATQPSAGSKVTDRCCSGTRKSWRSSPTWAVIRAASSCAASEHHGFTPYKATDPPPSRASSRCGAASAANTPQVPAGAGSPASPRIASASLCASSPRPTVRFSRLTAASTAQRAAVSPPPGWGNIRPNSSASRSAAAASSPAFCEASTRGSAQPGSRAIISVPGQWNSSCEHPRCRALGCCSLPLLPRFNPTEQRFNAMGRGQRRRMRLVSRLEDANQLDPAVAVGQKAARSIRPGRIRDALHGVWLGHPLHPVLVQVPVGAWLSASALDLLVPQADAAARRLVAAGLVASAPAIVAGAVDWSEQHEQQMRVGVVHALANSLAAALYGASLLARTPRTGRGLRVAGLAAAGFPGVLGGHISFPLAGGAHHAQ